MPLRRSLTALVPAALLLAGCGGSGGKSELAATALVGDLRLCLDKAGFEDMPATAEAATSALAAAYIESRFDRFLDCYLGPDLPTGEATTSTVKALRGHAVSTAIARYAAFNVTGMVGDSFNLRFQPTASLKQDAAVILVSVARADRGYSAASGLFPVMAPSERPTDFLPTVKRNLDFIDRVDRVMSVLDAVRDAAEPTVHRAQVILPRLIATIANPTPLGIRQSLRDLAGGLAKLAVIEQFAEAYRTDIRGNLSCAQAREAGRAAASGLCGASLAADWKAWDGALDEACGRLAKVGGVTNICTVRDR